MEKLNWLQVFRNLHKKNLCLSYGLYLIIYKQSSFHFHSKPIYTIKEFRE